MTEIPVGIQLYTVREHTGEEASFKETLTALAEMGYKGVEFAWAYGGMDPADLAFFIESLGLTCCGMHTSLEHILDPNSESYDYAAALKSPCVTTSLAGEVAKDWRATIAQVQQAGETAVAQGLCFSYHNHAQEFDKIDGEYALDLLYANTDPAAVQGELDTYWIKKGGEDPVPYIRKYAGRVPQIHLKDMNPDDGNFTEIGEGLMDLAGIFAVGSEVGAQWVIYEQDVCPGLAIDSARLSIDNLRRAGLA